MKIYCSVCGKQIISAYTYENDKYVTTSIGAKADCCGKVLCGHCSKDLDQYGLFPEERSALESE